MEILGQCRSSPAPADLVTAPQGVIKRCTTDTVQQRYGPEAHLDRLHFEAGTANLLRQQGGFVVGPQRLNMLSSLPAAPPFVCQP